MKPSLILSTMSLVVFWLPVQNALSQVDSVSEQWVARYNGPGNNYDYAYAIAVDESGNVYVTGSSFALDTYDDYATVKYDASGVQQWVARYNGPGNGGDYAQALAVDVQGNVYVTGYSWGSGTNNNYATIKYDASGVQQWVTRYTGPVNRGDIAYAIGVDVQGNVYVTGTSFVSGTNSDYTTIKYDASGVQQWVTRYNGPGNSLDYAFALVVDASSSVYVTGYSFGSGTDYDYATIKYDASGVQQWVARYNGPGNGYDSARDLVVDASSNVYVTGWSLGSGTSDDYATIKYDASGVQQWATRYNGPGNGADHAVALALDAAGNVHVTGYCTSSDGLYDYATIKYDASGVQQWDAFYNGPGNNVDGAYALAVDASGNVYVTGYCTGLGTFGDYATIKYDASGVQHWVARYNGPGNNFDYAYALAVDESGNVYVTGYGAGTTTTYDYTTIKYQQTPGTTIPCADISSFVGRCIGGSTKTLQFRVTLFNSTIWAGDSVTIDVDGTQYSSMIVTNGTHSRASFQISGVSVGEHTATVVDPACGLTERAACATDGPIVSAWEQSEVLFGDDSFDTISSESRVQGLGNYPNPFNPTTTIKYDLPADSHVSLKVYDVLGREVLSLVDGVETAGTHQVTLNASNLSSGVYFYRLKTGSFTETKRLVLMK